MIKMNSQEKVAIVTGSGSGIGRGIANYFAEQGFQIVIATINEEEGLEVEKEIISQGGICKYIQTDVSSEESIIRMIKETISLFKRVDVLVNNAGITRFKSIEDATIEDWNELINIDLRGVFLCSKHVVPEMEKQNKGSIINISSNHSIATLPNSEIYAAAKGGVNSMARSMALSLGPKNIRVNTISPGFTDTPHYRNWLANLEESQDVESEVLKLHPLGKISTPTDIAKLAYYLASDDSEMMNGENLVIDGGLSTRLYYSNQF